MKFNAIEIGIKIKKARLAKNMRQAELNLACDLPLSCISKIEHGHREPSASELLKIAHTLGTNIDSLLSEHDSFVSAEEIKIVEALREMPFEDYSRTLRGIESSIYFSAKYFDGDQKEFMLNLVQTLAKMGNIDTRIKSQFNETKRVKGPEAHYESRITH